MDRMDIKSAAPLAFSYIRISTDAQVQGDGLRRQSELSRKYADEHGLRLIEEFKLEDKGVSAFKGDNASTGALSRFLDAIQRGNVPKGSFLLVESLDRLSRQDVDAAMYLFLSITKAGVSIVTLADGQVYRAGANLPQLVYSLAIMSRANDESKMKSLRLSAAWRDKRDRVDTEKLTRIAPAWLTLRDDRKSFELVQERADVVRRIFRLSTDGVGTYSIVKTLNRDGILPFGRSNGWNESYIEKIVKNRAVLGEYQPHAMIDGKRRPVGDPVQGYYPAVVSEDEFYAAQAARRARATYKGGRKGVELKNLFTHIATCAYCGEPMRMVDKGSGPKGGRYLKCSAGIKGMGCTTKGWRYDDFERSFLYLAREVDLGAVMNAEADDAAARQREERLSALTEKSTSLQLQRERFAELSADPAVGIEFIRSKLAAVESELAKTNLEIETLRAEMDAAESKPALATEDLRQLIEQHGRLAGVEAYDHRVRLAARLRSVVTKLAISTEGDGPRLRKTLATLEQEESDPAFAESVRRHIEDVSAKMQRLNPAFLVTFAGGVSRQATVCADDPMEYVSEAVLQPDGSARVNGESYILFSARKPGGQ